jgi:transcriptional regulator with XRE-family HTH domain
MMIGDRLRQLREAKNLSQGHVEEKTGLLRCYTSRVENGHTVPSIETLEKYARALDVPLYQIFLADGEKPVKNGVSVSASSSIEGKLVTNLQRHIKKMSARDRKLLLVFAGQLSRRSAA